MPRLFDVGPLPQIKVPEVLDTNPLVPIDFGTITKATSEYSKMKFQERQEDRLAKAQQGTMLKAFADDLLGVLKSEDGSDLAPISPFQKQAIGKVRDQTSAAVSKMSTLLGINDYKSAYDVLFSTKADIFQDDNYKTAVSELQSLKGLLGEAAKNPNKYDDVAVGKLVEDMAASNDPFDVKRFTSPSLAFFDQDKITSEFFKGYAPAEISEYKVFTPSGLDPSFDKNLREGDVKGLYQMGPDAIKEDLDYSIKTNERYQQWLESRGIEIGSKEYEAFLNSEVSGILMQGPGVQYITEDQEDGTKKILGAYKQTGVTGVKKVVEDDASSSSKSSKSQTRNDDILFGMSGETQPVAMATDWNQSYDAYKQAYTQNENLAMASAQAFNTMTKGFAINGVGGDSPDDMVNIINMVKQFGPQAVKDNITVTDANGNINVEKENQIIDKWLPTAMGAYDQRKILNNGEKYAMAGKYDEFIAEIPEKYRAKAISELKIAKGPEGEIIIGNPKPRPLGEVQTEEDMVINGVLTAKERIIDKYLKDSYNSYVAPKEEKYKFKRLNPEEGSEAFAQDRMLAKAVSDDVLSGNTTFYSANEKYNNGKPMYIKNLNDKAAPPGDVGPWTDMRVEGVYTNPKGGSFGLVAYPRTPISDDLAKSIQSKDPWGGDDPVTNDYTRQGRLVREGSHWFYESNEQIIVPWNKFGADFYDSYFSRNGSLAGVYDNLIHSLKGEIKDGEPVQVDFGGTPMYITPVGEGEARRFRITATASTVEKIEDLPLPPSVSSSTPDADKYKSKSYPASTPTPTDDQVAEATEKMTKLAEDKPYLKDLMPNGRIGTPPAQPNIKGIVSDRPQANDKHKTWAQQVAPSQIQTESGGDQSAVSPKGNVGVMQLGEAAAKEAAAALGIAYDPERLKTDAEYNQTLGMQYQTLMFKKYDDVNLGLAAYNWGPGKVDALIAKIGNPAKQEVTWEEFAEQLPEETSNYVQKISGEANIKTPTPIPGGPRIYETDAAGLKTVMERAGEANLTPASEQIDIHSFKHISFDENAAANFDKLSTQAKKVLKTLENGKWELTTSSGYRTEEQNKAAGGADNSTHLSGNAIDISFRDKEGKLLYNAYMEARWAGKEKEKEFLIQHFGTSDLKIIGPHNSDDHDDHLHIETK